MADPQFRLVCRPTALADTPRAWAREMLREGEIALLPGAGGLADVDAVTHRLDLMSVIVVRGESSPTTQAETVIAFADSLPLVWVEDAFSERVSGWARERGAMTLLVENGAALEDGDRARIARFVAALGRQSE